MKNNLIALMCGLAFAGGLGISGMLFPQRILAFLNITSGVWNPSLMFVMVGAIAAYAAIFQIAKSTGVSWTGRNIDIPIRGKIDRRLISGAVLFGIGWGMSGLCPGPAIAAVGSFLPSAILFAGAMLVGGLIAGKIPEKIL